MTSMSPGDKERGREVLTTPFAATVQCLAVHQTFPPRSAITTNSGRSHSLTCLSPQILLSPRLPSSCRQSLYSISLQKSGTHCGLPLCLGPSLARDPPPPAISSCQWAPGATPAFLSGFMCPMGYTGGLPSLLPWGDTDAQVTGALSTLRDLLSLSDFLSGSQKSSFFIPEVEWGQCSLLPVCPPPSSG